KLDVPKDIKLKDPKDWTIIGKPLKRLDTVDKTNGKMIYGIDVKLPGLLNAAVRACPVFGGKVKSFDASKVATMPGIKKVVPVGDNAVAVVADTWCTRRAPSMRRRSNGTTGRTRRCRARASRSF